MTSSVFSIFMILLWGASLLLGGILWQHIAHHKDVYISFLDIGQGDAILIRQGDNQVLIDGGRSGKVVREKLGMMMPFWDTYLEVMVATHPDEDHIGGLLDLFTFYVIGMVLDTKMTSDSETYHVLQEKIQESAEQQKTERRETFAGMKITLPESGVFEVQHPFGTEEGNTSKDTNATSIVMTFTTHSGESFLFTGDLPSTEEVYIPTPTQPITVLKAGHHGSKYSSSQNFLARMRPRDVIISAGKNNRYHHPAPEVLERLTHISAIVFRTDMQGTVTYHCSAEVTANCVVSSDKD